MKSLEFFERNLWIPSFPLIQNEGLLVYTLSYLSPSQILYTESIELTSAPAHTIRPGCHRHPAFWKWSKEDLCLYIMDDCNKGICTHWQLYNCTVLTLSSCSWLLFSWRQFLLTTPSIILAWKSRKWYFWGFNYLSILSAVCICLSINKIMWNWTV